MKTDKELDFLESYIATDDPAINIFRVKQRVRSGGHDVPEEKIISRYVRSLQNLPLAVAETDRAYMFDNSGNVSVWLCEITSGNSIEFKQDEIPYWLYQNVVKALTL